MADIQHWYLGDAIPTSDIGNEVRTAAAYAAIITGHPQMVHTHARGRGTCPGRSCEHVNPS